MNTILYKIINLCEFLLSKNIKQIWCKHKNMWSDYMQSRCPDCNYSFITRVDY